MDGRGKPLSRDGVKMIAALAMLLNHIAAVFLPEGTWPCELLTSMGCFAAPSMVFFLVEGYGKTRSKKRYLLRLFVFGAVSQVPYSLAFQDGEALFNMLFSLCLCFGLVWTEREVEPLWARACMGAGIIILSLWCDWSFLAPAFTLLFLWAEGSRDRLGWAFGAAAAAFGLITLAHGAGVLPVGMNLLLAALNMLVIGAAGGCILHLYNGRRARRGGTFFKWFFYGFYPLHLLALAALDLLIR